MVLLNASNLWKDYQGLFAFAVKGKLDMTVKASGCTWHVALHCLGYSVFLAIAANLTRAWDFRFSRQGGQGTHEGRPRPSRPSRQGRAPRKLAFVQFADEPIRCRSIAAGLVAEDFHMKMPWVIAIE